MSIRLHRMIDELKAAYEQLVKRVEALEQAITPAPPTTNPNERPKRRGKAPN